MREDDKARDVAQRAKLRAKKQVEAVKHSHKDVYKYTHETDVCLAKMCDEGSNGSYRFSFAAVRGS